MKGQPYLIPSALSEVDGLGLVTTDNQPVAMEPTAFALRNGMPVITNYNTRMLKAILGEPDCASYHIPAIRK